MKASSDFLARALASGLFLSYLPAFLFRDWTLKGTGLIGSLWGLVLIKGLPLDPVKASIVMAGAVLVSVAISDVAEETMHHKDDPRIVIDEFVGYWMSVIFLPRTWGVLAAAFVLFRLFDVLKMPWIREVGELPGGWGVVMDDLFAGACANLLLQVAQLIHPF